MNYGFIKACAVSPALRVADCPYNAQETIEAMQQAAEDGCQLTVFPELGLTGYTCGDLFLQQPLLDAAEAALREILKASEALQLVALVGLPVSFVQYVLLHRNYTTVSRWEDIVCALIGWGLLLLLEPLLLARFGTTAGKWCMGITVTRPDGERLSYSEALNRTALVWFYGAGLGLPLVELVCSYLSYRRYTRGEELAWEEGSVERFDGRGTGKMVLLFMACWAVRGTLTVAMVLAAMLPPNRGDLTVAEFAENVNFYRGYFDYGERWSLDENGEWAENQYENVVYFGGGDGPAPFTYTVEDGTLRAVHWAYNETAETIYGTGDENARMAYLALAAAQKGTSLFNIRNVVKQIGSNSWAGDADYSAAWKNIEMRYDARIEGEYYYSEGFFLSVQDGQPITVTLTFDARLAE